MVDEHPLMARQHPPLDSEFLAAPPGRRYNVEPMSGTQITWHDALLMPEDTRRYEAIEGDLHVIPAPSRRHQRTSHRLAVELDRVLVEPGYGEVYEAPFGVEFPDTEEGVQPDLLFVSKERLEIIGEDWVRGAPDLVVEILSPSTAEKDRGVKMKLYRRHGVGEYWIVDPDAKEVEVWVFAAGARQPQRYRERMPVRVAGSVVGHLDLAVIFGA